MSMSRVKLNFGQMICALAQSALEVIAKRQHSTSLILICQKYVLRSISFGPILSFDNDHMMGAISNVYRLIDGKETEVTTTASKLIQYADSNYQVVLKLQGPPNLFYYGVFIDYEVAKS
ncbi:unnamed protein product [Rotaria magnacalcarata]|uniref:Uncharacterized protein n=1 Tax=Rotaria magnacalcarata TaxID=392030 RepID=A0A815ZC56_9BILA|nr:unnamed protein product [Rotaria magnacalcarata]